MRKIWVVVFLIFFLIISFYNIVSRIKWDTKRTIRFVIDIDYFVENKIDFKTIINDLEFTKIFAISYDPQINKIFFSVNPNVKILLKIDSDKRYNFEDLTKFIDEYRKNIFSICFSPISGFPIRAIPLEGRKITNTDFENFIERYNLLKINFEFSKEIIRSKKSN